MKFEQYLQNYEILKVKMLQINWFENQKLLENNQILQMKKFQID